MTKPGTLIGGKYRLTRQLGTGAMGVVWAATHEKLSREVAIKFIAYSNAELRLRMLREARACGAIKHSNIVEVLDVDQTAEGDPYLVMQLLSGETLGELLQRQRRLEAPHAASIARDVARALVAAHAAGIVHRDLKPANVFLNDEVDGSGATTRVVKVLDFGVSKNILTDSADGLATVTGGMVGSPAYMSPEQAQAKRDVDFRSDLWSLGVVLFEMLTGRRPFLGEAQQLLAKIIMERAPLISDFVRNADPGLAQLVARCLERDRAQRVQSAAQLVEMLGPFCDGAAGARPRPPLESSGVEPAPFSPSPHAPVFGPPSQQPPPPAAHVDDEVATARLDPRMLAPFAPPARSPLLANTLPLADAPPVSVAASVTAPLPEPKAGPPSSGPPRVVGFGPPPPPSDMGSERPPPPSAFGAKGTIKISRDQIPSSPFRQAPPAPPPPPSQPASAGPFDFSSSPSYAAPTSVPPTPDGGSSPRIPGITSSTAPLLAAPPAAPSAVDSGSAGLEAPPPRRRMAMYVVAGVVMLAVAILTIAAVQIATHHGAPPAPAASASVSTGAAPPIPPQAAPSPAPAVASAPASTRAGVPDAAPSASSKPSPSGTAPKPVAGKPKPQKKVAPFMQGKVTDTWDPGHP